MKAIGASIQCKGCQQDFVLESEKYWRHHGSMCRPCLRVRQIAAQKKYRGSEHGIVAINRLRERTKPRRYELAKKRRERAYRLITESKNVPCADCGRKYPSYVMDFDHLGNKKFCISKSGALHSMMVLRDEISKCDVVCSNCHRIRTHSRRNKTFTSAAEVIRK